MRLNIYYVSTYPLVYYGIAEYCRMLASFIISVRRVHITVINVNFDNSTHRVDAYGIEVHTVRSFDYRGVLSEIVSIGNVDVVHIQHEYSIYGYGTTL